VLLDQGLLRIITVESNHQILTDHPARHVAVDHPGHAAEHLALDHSGPWIDDLADPVGELLRIAHGFKSRVAITRQTSA
jgi:hypothetical protein